MVIGPDAFLVISTVFVLTIILIFGIYVVKGLCTSSSPLSSNWFKFISKKRKASEERNQEKNNNGNVSQAPEKILQPNPVTGSSTPQPFIRGPQGHGFYTSGPWKIDTLGNDLATQFSQPQLMMADYFAMMDPLDPSALMDQEGSLNGTGLLNQPVVQMMSLKNDYWTSNSNSNEYDGYSPHSMTIEMPTSYGDAIDIQQSDSDAMIMFM